MSELPLMSATKNKHNITLQLLVNEIHEPKLLKELIKDYESLIDPSSKYQMESIIAILSIRMKQIAINFSSTNAYNKSCLQQIEKLAKYSSHAKELLSSIDNTINASDTESPISVSASHLLEDVEATDYSIQKMYLVFMDETFEESSTDLESLFKKYKKLDEMLSNNTGTPEWMMKQVKMDTKELNHYAKEIALTPIKTTTIATYRNSLPIFNAAYSFNEQIAQEKANNPLIDNNLVTNVQEFIEKLNQIGVLFNEWINLLYQYDQQLSVVKDHIESFGIIAKKMISTK